MTKKRIILIASLIVVFGLGIGIYLYLHQEKSISGLPATYPTLNWIKPTTDKGWEEDIKAEGLNYRMDFQLEQVKESLETDLNGANLKLFQQTEYPDSIRWELKQGGIEEPELTKQVNEKVAQYKYEYERIAQALERVTKEIELRKAGKVDRTNDILSASPSTEQEKIEQDKLKAKIK